MNGCSTNISKTDLELKQLRGYIKTVTEKCYSVQYDGAEYNIGPRKRDTVDILKFNFEPWDSCTHFNTHGMITKTCRLSCEDVVTVEYKYEYDAIGNIVKSTTTSDNKNLIEKFIYQYNTDNKLFKIKGFKNNFVNVIQELVYDKRGDLMQKIYYSKNNERIKRIDYTYNSKHQLVKEYVNEYKSKCIFPYYYIDYLYDNNGLIYKENVNYNRDRESYCNIYEFNNKGDKTKFQRLNSFGFPVIDVRYEYQYDTKSNWISAKLIDNDSVKYIIKRKIEYY